MSVNNVNRCRHQVLFGDDCITINDFMENKIEMTSRETLMNAISYLNDNSQKKNMLDAAKTPVI